MADCDEFPDLYFPDDDGNFIWEKTGWDDDHEGRTRELYYFETFQEAKNWAIKNPGKSFTKHENGYGFVSNNDSDGCNNAPPNKIEKSSFEQENRFLGLDGFEVSNIFTKFLSRLSPHLLYQYTKAPSNFSKNTFIGELNKLSKDEILELYMVLNDYLEICKRDFELLKAFIRENRKVPSKYGVEQQLQWINDLEASIDLCHRHQAIDEEKEKLRSYLRYIQGAIRDVDEVFENGYMSDAKSAVYGLSVRLEDLGITDQAILAVLVKMASECWSAISSSGGSDPYKRAGQAMAELGKIEKYVQGLL